MNANKLNLRELTLGLTLTKGLGIGTYFQYQKQFPDNLEFLKELQTNFPINTEALNSTINKLIKTNTNYVCEWEENYPLLLKQIPDRPIILFYIGDLNVLNAPTLGIVGTRGVDSYGINITKKFAEELCNKYTIVSGMAMGVDAIAMNTAIQNQGNVVAVLAGPANEAAPLANIKLWEQIILQGGVVVSEFPPGTAVRPGMFPRRNRIIAGLSNKLLVTQASIKSGAIITAKLAFDYNREVYAVPSQIISNVKSGTNWLIQQNMAILVQTTTDIDPFAEINSIKMPEILDSMEKRVFLAIQNNIANIDSLALELNLGIGEISKIVANLQIKGLISVSLSGNLVTNQI